MWGFDLFVVLIRISLIIIAAMKLKDTYSLEEKLWPA